MFVQASSVLGRSPFPSLRRPRTLRHRRHALTPLAAGKRGREGHSTLAL